MSINLFGQLAGFVGRVQDLVVEDGEVQRQTQPDGMCRLHLALADLEGILVRSLRVIHHGCTRTSECDGGEEREQGRITKRRTSLLLGSYSLGDNISPSAIIIIIIITHQYHLGSNNDNYDHNNNDMIARGQLLKII